MRLKTKDMILVALFSALMAVGAYIKIPIPPVPISMQTFFCALAGIILGSRLGALSQVIYLLIGLAGLPVFTQGGGPQYVLNPTFGYILGFVAGAWTTGRLSESLGKISFPKALISVLSGLLAIYAVGVPYMYMIVRLYNNSADYTFMAAVAAGFTPFILKDLVMFVIAAVLASQLVPLLRRSGYLGNTG